MAHALTSSIIALLHDEWMVSLALDNNENPYLVVRAKNGAMLDIALLANIGKSSCINLQPPGFNQQIKLLEGEYDAYASYNC